MGKRVFFEEKKLKRLIYVFSITLVISIIAFLIIFVMYNKKLKEQSNSQLLELGQNKDIVSNEELVDISEVEETSSDLDKTVPDSKSLEKEENTAIESKKVSTTPVSSTVENTVTNTIKTNNSNSDNEIEKNLISNNTIKELTFIAPVSGEILKDFAIDTLIYSNTLEEWTTHNGIDIKADKTTIVAASEKGTVESIKTDPRYGLTVTIAHENGFKTIYSNLLTTEFVTEGEIVEKGQTIATVGESSSFEISDEAHLHFEIYKDGICVNPTIYLKDI